MPDRSSELREIWNRLVWSDTKLRSYTHNIHPYNVVNTQESVRDLSKLMYCGEINFVQYFVQRYKVEDQVGQCLHYNYRVRIEYYLEDTCQDNQNKIIDFFECLDEVIDNRLGPHWETFVTSFSRQDSYPEVELFGEIENKQVYQGSYEYFGELFT